MATTSGEETQVSQVDNLLNEFNKLVENYELEQAGETVSRVEGLLGPEHEDTLDLKCSLAFHFRQVGEYDEAEGIDRQVHTIRERVLGPDHIDTAKALDNIALDLKGQYRFEEALALEEKALETALKAEGEDSESTQICMSNLANSYNRAGRAQEAADLHEKALQYRTNHFGERDRETIVFMDMLASDYRQLGQVDNAIARQEEALNIAKDSLGEADVTTLKVSVNLAESYGRLGTAEGDEKKIAVLEDAYKLTHADPEATNDPFTITVMNNLAIAYANASRFADAHPLLKAAYEWNVDKLGHDHPQTKVAWDSYEYVTEKFNEELGLVRTYPIAPEVLYGTHEQ